MTEGPLVIVIVGGLIGCFFFCSRLLAVLSVTCLISRPFLYSQ